MLGEIGHNDRPVSEADIAEGRVSHIVTNLWIDEESRGMGQVFILGTPAGRNLYTLMKAGCRIKTSSRASGDFKKDVTFEGMPVVDENNYYLETFDFVINPGFLETNPLIKENVDKIKKDMEKKDMELAEKLLQKLEDEKKALAESLDTTKIEKDEAIAKSESLEEKVTLLESELNELKEAKTLAEALEAEKTELSEKLNSITEELSAYKKACEDVSAQELEEGLTKTANVLEAYSKLGSPLSTVFPISRTVISCNAKCSTGSGKQCGYFD
jgi:hypothetical protein